MQEEQDTCRICSAPAEPDQPLFHPCKCSGTIRYIHQDCLTEWLAHSKKKTCDVCKYPYSFTKVYSKDMPERLPVLLVMRQFSRQVVSALLFGLRAALVATVWLAALPWATIWTWRMYFALGNSTAWWISALKRPQSDVDFYTFSVANITSHNNVTSFPTTDAQQPTPTSIFQHPVYKAVTSDIFAGQIIAAIIVLTFVAVFLLREWITQNARPGVFEEGDVPIDAAVPGGLPPPPELVPIPAVHAPPALPVVAEPVHDRAPPHDGSASQARVKKLRTRADLQAPEDSPGAGPSRVAKGKRRAHTSAREERKTAESYRIRRGQKALGADDNLDQLLAGLGDKHGQVLRDVVRRVDEVDEEIFRRHTRRKPTEEWSPERSRARMRPRGELPASSEFTFRAPGPAYPSSSTASGSTAPAPRSNSVVPYKENGYGDPPAYNPFLPSRLRRDRHSDSDSDEREDERDRTPTRPSTPVLNASSSTSFTFNLDRVETSSAPPSASSSTPLGLRRPPLPTITLPPSPVPSFSGNALQSSRGHTPLASPVSPNLATYRAPEDLDAEPPLSDDYFADSNDLIDLNALDEERRRYFRELREMDVIDSDEDGEWESIAHQPGRLAFEAERQAIAQLRDADILDDELDEGQWSDEDGEGVHEEEENDEVAEDDEDIVNVIPAPPVVAGEGGPAARRVVRAQLPGPQPQEELDPEGNIEDDMDGALEAIGLRGPLVGVLQNAVLMTFILDTTIGLGIWLPFTIGKSTALLTLNPRRAVQLLHLPLRLIRLITDPVVDTVLLLVSRVLLPPMTRLGQMVLASSLHGLNSVVGQSRVDELKKLSAVAYGRVLQFPDQVLKRAIPAVSDVSEAQPTTSYLYRLLEEDTTVMRAIEPVFAPLGKNIRNLSQEGKTSWIHFSTGDTPNDRMFAVVLGYAVVGLLLAIYLNILTVGSMKSAGRAVRNAVRQQLLVVKVAAFILIELVIFPLGCGVMLDVCTVWLFPQGSFRSRAAFLMYAPLTAVFYHWVLGTMFMYQFAVLLSGCRGIMRPGAMWFIKDPQDQNFHPIRDILERPTLVQIRKLILSAMMYGFVVASGVATVASILRVFSRTIMPFRWKIREPLSEVPIDLIFLQLVLPYTLESFRPRKLLKRSGLYVWKYFASRLRLSSYMFGSRYPAEEFTPKTWSWRSLLWEDGIQMDDAEAVHDGSFRRVPNSDNVALVRGSPATAEVLEDGTPVDEAARKLIDAQNAETQRSKRLVKDDYTVVYIPPQLRYRVLVFLFCLWTIGSIMLASVLAAPILLGRGFFRLVFPHDVHDGYSFIVGFYLLWGCGLVANALDRFDKRRQRRWIDAEPHAEWWFYLTKRALLWVAQSLYLLVTVGIIIPTLVGLTFELYIVQPLRYTANPLVEPRIRMVEMWALGLLYMKIVLRSLRMGPPRRGMMRAIDRMLRNGWTHADPLRATEEVIAPVIFGLLGMILFPAVVLWGITRVVTIPLDGSFLFMHVYPGMFTVAGLAHASYAFSRVTKSWSQTIRDKEFLVEMRLRNLEAVPEKKAKDHAKAKDDYPTEAED